MLSWEEKVKLKALISDTVRWMCKDGLMPHLLGEFCVEGLIGVTVGQHELLMVSINEKLCGEVTRSPAHTQTTEALSTAPPTLITASPNSGQSTKRKITDKTIWSEDVHITTEDANNTKKARYSYSSQHVVAVDQHNSEDTQGPMGENTINVNTARYSESASERIQDKHTGSLVMSVEECETDFLLSPETVSNSVTNSAASTNVNRPPQSPAVEINSGKDVDGVKTPPSTERRRTRRSSARYDGANLEEAKSNKSGQCGKDVNLSTLKNASGLRAKFGEDMNAAAANTEVLVNNYNKSDNREKTNVDSEYPVESPCIKDLDLHVLDSTGIPSVSVDVHKDAEHGDSDTDNAFDDLDDESDTDRILIAKSIVCAKPSSSTSVIQSQAGEMETSSASPGRNQSSYSSGDQAVGDSVRQNHPHATDMVVQFSVKSEFSEEGQDEDTCNQLVLQITDIQPIAVITVKTEPVEQDDLETRPVDGNVEAVSEKKQFPAGIAMDSDTPHTTENNYWKKKKNAENAKKYREKKKAENLTEYRLKESERKKKQRAKRKKDPHKLQRDRELARIRANRYRQKMKANVTRVKKEFVKKVLTETEHEKLKEYNRLRKQASRRKLSSQKHQIIRERDNLAKKKKREANQASLQDYQTTMTAEQLQMELHPFATAVTEPIP